MTASQVITDLQKLISVHGDAEVDLVLDPLTGERQAFRVGAAIGGDGRPGGKAQVYFALVPVGMSQTVRT